MSGAGDDPPDHAGRDVDRLPFTPGSTIIKLFQDVPRADLEMLFPNAQVRMRRIDKLLIGVPAVVSGIIVVGALLQIGHGDTVITTLGFVAIMLASINVFGGFAVTRRMLAMFSRS